jgi:TolB-like protein/Tfp pilus assembly protein PilF
LTALLILSVVAAWQWRSHRLSAPRATQMIAVLPFRPLNANERDEAFELGMADALIGRLSRFSHVAVASINSVRTFNRLDQDPLAAGRELGAGAVLEGHMQRNGDLIHVTARLLGVSDGTALWTGSFDEKFNDVFVVQDAIADKVSSALSLSIEGAKPVADTHFTKDIEAYKLYVAGRYHMAKPTADELHLSVDFFRKAIDHDPSYALAYAGLADAYRRLPMVADEEPKAVFPLARAAASKALEIDDSLADAHSSMGWIACWFDWDWATSEREFQRAIALNPNISEAHLGYMTLLGATGRRAEATREGRRALELDPLSPLIRALAATSLGSPALAEQELRKSLAIDSDFWVTHFALGGTAIAQGRVTDSIAEYTKAKNLSNGNLVAAASLGYVLAKSGDTATAKTMLDDLLTRSKDGYIPPVTIASIYSGLGDAAQTIAWLERAYDAHDVRLSFIQGDPRWNFLRKEPRFIAIEERMGLKAAAKGTNIE